MIRIERDFRQADHRRALAILVLRERGGGGQPARVAPHDFHDGHGFEVVNRGITHQLLDRRADVFGGRAVARRVVGVGQIVVDRLGNADKADVAADFGGVVAQFEDGIHAVVAADIEEVADIIAAQHVENFLIDGLHLVAFRQFVAAASQIRSGGVAQQGELPRRAEHVRQVDHVVLEQPLNAVAHAVNMLYAVLAAGAENARKAGIDDTGGAAALADNRVDAHACNRSLSIFFRVMARPSRRQAILSIIPSG